MQNVGTDEVEASLTAYTSAWKWDERSMYFGAGWTEFSHLHTRTNPDKPTTDDHFEVNFVKLTGRGVYVGDGVTLFNSLADWWGEGDEKVYVNGENFLRTSAPVRKTITVMPGACTMLSAIRLLPSRMEQAPLSVGTSPMCAIVVWMPFLSASH